MALAFIKVEPVDRGWVVLDRKLWYTKDREAVVEDGDPRAASLLGSAGKKVLASEAERLGLLEGRGVRQDPAAEKGDPPDLGPEDAKLEDLTVPQLTARLKEAGLATSGPKKALIERLKSFSPEQDKMRQPGGNK